MVESELGVPFEDVYELVEPEPIAAASIGQVSGKESATCVHDIVASFILCCARALLWCAQFQVLLL